MPPTTLPEDPVDAGMTVLGSAMDATLKAIKTLGRVANRTTKQGNNRVTVQLRDAWVDKAYADTLDAVENAFEQIRNPGVKIAASGYGAQLEALEDDEEFDEDDED